VVVIPIIYKRRNALPAVIQEASLGRKPGDGKLLTARREGTLK
jgi:hypothetical protein